MAQDQRDPFDRGMNLNMGFLLSKASGDDVVVFHDVDTLPVDAHPKGYPEPTHDNEMLHLYGHEHSCGGILCTTAACFKRIGGFDSIPHWGGEDVAMQTRARTFGVRLNKTLRVERFQGNDFVELDMDANTIPNPTAHRLWEKDIFVRKEKKIRSTLPDCSKPGALYSRRRGIHVYEVEPLEDRVILCKVRIEKLV